MPSTDTSVDAMPPATDPAPPASDSAPPASDSTPSVSDSTPPQPAKVALKPPSPQVAEKKIKELIEVIKALVVSEFQVMFYTL